MSKRPANPHRQSGHDDCRLHYHRRRLVGIDRSTKWDASWFCRRVLRRRYKSDYRMLRYMLDRRDRLPISFRVEGKIPNIKIRLENRTLGASPCAARPAATTRTWKNTPAKHQQETKPGCPTRSSAFLIASAGRITMQEILSRSGRRAYRIY